MLYEFIKNIDWLRQVKLFVETFSLLVFVGIVVWVIPILVNYAMNVSRVHQKIREWVVILLRMAIMTAGAFLVGDILGYTSDVVLAIIGTVFGVGISLAIKDSLSNLVAGFMLFGSQTFALTDEISSPSSGFAGEIIAFHTQHVKLHVPGKPPNEYTLVPNSYLWTSIIHVKQGFQSLRASLITRGIRQSTPLDEIEIVY